MSFAGVIARSREESRPDWGPPPPKRRGAPNIVVILMDDLSLDHKSRRQLCSV